MTFLLVILYSIAAIAFSFGAAFLITSPLSAYPDRCMRKGLRALIVCLVFLAPAVYLST